MSRLRRYGVFAAISLGVVAADQIVKLIIDEWLVLYESRDVIPGFLSLTYTRNRGAVFGLFSHSDLPAQAVVMPLAGLAALTAVLYYFLRLPPDRLLPRVSLSLVCGGALGNLIDRIRLGYVIDFLDVYWRSYHWPTFNVADSAISVGVALLLFDMLRDSPAQSNEREADNVARAAGRME